MNWLEKITPENFDKSFDIQQVLTQSAFYPASGTDGSHIPVFSHKGIVSFVNVDYSLPKEQVEQAMKYDFIGVGYRLIGIKHIGEDEITPNGFHPVNIPFNKHEKERLDKLPEVLKSMNAVGFTPFALWAVYELDPDAKVKSSGKAERFSLLHIGGEACATFDATYLANGLNPGAIAIIRPSQGYGDNWTLFTNPDFRLHTMLKMNCKNKHQEMPVYLLSDNSFKKEACWPDYTYAGKEYSDHSSLLHLFRRN